MTFPRRLRHARSLAHKPLAQNGPHNFSASYALCHYPSGSVYSFIPKNACTSMRVSLAWDHGCIADPLADWTWVHANNPTFCASLRELVTARFTFAILRCPHERLASAFLDKIVGRNVEFWNLHRRQKETFSPDDMTFRDFVTCVTKPSERAADPHWRPQSDFLVYETYDALYSMSQIADGFSDISARTGLQIIDARPLSQHGRDRHNLLPGSDHSDTPLHILGEARRNGQVPSPASLYNSDLAQLVRQAYAADFRLYCDAFGLSGLLFPGLSQSLLDQSQ